MSRHSSIPSALSETAKTPKCTVDLCMHLTSHSCISSSFRGRIRARRKRILALHHNVKSSDYTAYIAFHRASDFTGHDTICSAQTWVFVKAHCADISPTAALGWPWLSATGWHHRGSAWKEESSLMMDGRQAQRLVGRDLDLVVRAICLPTPADAVSAFIPSCLRQVCMFHVTTWI